MIVSKGFVSALVAYKMMSLVGIKRGQFLACERWGELAQAIFMACWDLAVFGQKQPTE